MTKAEAMAIKQRVDSALKSVYEVTKYEEGTSIDLDDALHALEDAEHELSCIKAMVDVQLG